MKARVKATGEIVEVNEFCTLRDSGERTYYWVNALELITKDNPDYWTRLEHQYAGMAMQGILSNPELFKATAKNAEEFGLIVPQAVAIDANCFATALIKKLKEEK